MNSLPCHWFRLPISFLSSCSGNCCRPAELRATVNWENECRHREQDLLLILAHQLETEGSKGRCSLFAGSSFKPRGGGGVSANRLAGAGRAGAGWLGAGVAGSDWQGEEATCAQRHPQQTCRSVQRFPQVITLHFLKVLSAALWCRAHCETDRSHYRESSWYSIPMVIVVRPANRTWVPDEISLPRVNWRGVPPARKSLARFSGLKTGPNSCTVWYPQPKAQPAGVFFRGASVKLRTVKNIQSNWVSTRSSEVFHFLCLNSHATDHISFWRFRWLCVCLIPVFRSWVFPAIAALNNHGSGHL